MILCLYPLDTGRIKRAERVGRSRGREGGREGVVKEDIVVTRDILLITDDATGLSQLRTHTAGPEGDVASGLVGTGLGRCQRPKA